MNSRLLKWLLIIGIVLDLAISSIILVQQNQIEHNANKSNCWSSVLDYAIQKMPKVHKAELIKKADYCGTLK